jgi:hypothetical protein
MLPPLDYLAWAHRHYVGLRFDLASSGLAPLTAEELGPPSLAVHDYGAPAEFRARVSERFGVAPDEVVSALGASGALFLVYLSLFSRGDEILVEQPAYEPLVRTAEGLGLVVRRFPRTREAGYALDPAVVLAHITPATRAVVVSDLHNPSGVALDHAALAPIAEKLSRQGAWLVIDEVYAELVAPRRTARSLAYNIITFGSLTKSYGLPWIRAGYVLLPPEAAVLAGRAVLHLAGNLPPAVAAFGAHAFSRLEALEQRRHALQEGKRAVVDQWLDRHRAVLSWQPPAPGSLFGLVHDARGHNLRPWLERGAAEHGVLAAPGSFFDTPSAFRLGMTLPREKLEPALAALELTLGL